MAATTRTRQSRSIAIEAAADLPVQVRVHVRQEITETLAPAGHAPYDEVVETVLATLISPAEYKHVTRLRMCITRARMRASGAAGELEQTRGQADLVDHLADLDRLIAQPLAKAREIVDELIAKGYLRVSDHEVAPVSEVLKPHRPQRRRGSRKTAA